MNDVANNSQLVELLKLIRKGFTDLAGGAGGRPYNLIAQVYTANEYVPVARNCLGFMFTNVGDQTATVNGIVIFPSATPLTALGDSRVIAAHKNDIYMGNINLSFRGAAGLIPGVEIVQLYYI